jgi:hypothetical protein
MSETEQLVERISKRPYDRELHLRHLQLAKATDDLDGARELFAQFHPLTAELWLDWIRDHLSRPSSHTPEGATALTELFDRAEKDVLSIDICLEHALFALRSFCTSRGLSVPLDDGEEMGEAAAVDDKLQELWSEHFTREQLRAASARGTQHLMEGHRVWAIWQAFETLLLDHAPS